jgi:transcriptional regulator with XRE-family HTH domain
MGRTIYNLGELPDVPELLKKWGEQLREARIARNDSMALFAMRLGVSEGTVRAMERGSPTVQIGTWFGALSILDRLEELKDVLAPRESLIERSRKIRAGRVRKRASPKRS